MQDSSFRTKLDPKQIDLKISLATRILTIGSCFSDSIGEKLNRHKFKTLVNPFGTTYNPISIFNLLTSEGIKINKFVENGGMFFHYDFHSEFRAEDQRSLEKMLSNEKKKVSDFLKDTDWLVITFGTAWVYELKKSTEIVANCHKVPQREFSKRLLGLKEMIKGFDQTVGHLQDLNPELKILLTVSPVRHISDGIEENQLSKSMLRVMCDFATSSYDHVYYFPSYEIMMDDLRDYRFYKDDLIHPTKFAEDYIWDIFQRSFFDRDTMDFIKEWDSILSAMIHRPFNPNSDEHIKFIKTQIQKISQLSTHVDVKEELNYFESQLLA
jgi:hypothetical protein